MVPEKLKKIGKDIVDYPDHDVEVISTKDWLSRFWTNPVPHVTFPSSPSSPR
jgi:sodium-independent sulfate anion transporter 11